MAVSVERGVFSAAVGLGGTGAIMMWPEQWWIGLGLIVFAVMILLWGVRIHNQHVWSAAWGRIRPRQVINEALEEVSTPSVALDDMVVPPSFPPRHAEICRELADRLTKLHSGASLASVWARRRLGFSPIHFIAFGRQAARARGLARQIAYDPDTYGPVMVYIKLACMSVYLENHGKDGTPPLKEMHKMNGPLYEALHKGGGVKVPLDEANAMIEAHDKDFG